MKTSFIFCFFFSSRRRHTRFDCDWSSDVCSSDLLEIHQDAPRELLDRGGPGVRERALDVAPEGAQEERAGAALEADLVGMDDERGPQAHHQPISAARARARARSSGGVTFMNATSGARWRA